MLTKLCLAIVGGLTILPQMATADSFTGACVEASVPKQVFAARNGKWTELTPEQWQFLRGVYVMNPQTPAGLPFGDKAVLAQVENYPDGLVFFIDGDKACTPMRAPPELLALIQEVGTAKINHPGAGM
jgi:hypothetical protein